MLRSQTEGLAQLPPIGLKQDATTSDAETAPEVKEGTATPEQNDSTAVDAQATAQSNAPEGPAVSETQAIEPAAPTSDAPSASALDAYHQKPAELSLFPKKPQTSSADLILPVLLFSIVTSNPPRLASNLLFIQRFRAESLVRGEASYCLVNVQAAVAFLENVDPPALGLSGTGQVLR